jgi:putative PIN family toxin of toxin-antitoxin system
MNARVCIIDTNIVVAGLISADPTSPPVQILNAMLDGKMIYLLSAELFNEYSNVLRRPRIARHHRLTDDELDVFLTELVANAIWREPVSAGEAPDPGDKHLWSLLSSEPDSQLVTGDQLLIEHPPGKSSVLSARSYVDLFMT